MHTHQAHTMHTHQAHTMHTHQAHTMHTVYVVLLIGYASGPYKHASHAKAVLSHCHKHILQQHICILHCRLPQVIPPSWKKDKPPHTNFFETAFVYAIVNSKCPVPAAQLTEMTMVMLCQYWPLIYLSCSCEEIREFGH